MPFAVILGEDELAQGKVRVKEMGLEEGHPEKEGVLVDLKDLTKEVKARLAKKNSAAATTGVEKQIEGLTVQETPKTEDAGV